MKELGRLEGQLATLQHELAAMALKHSSMEDQMGLLPQKIQAMRDEVSGHCPGITDRRAGHCVGLVFRQTVDIQGGLLLTPSSWGSCSPHLFPSALHSLLSVLQAPPLMMSPLVPRWNRRPPPGLPSSFKVVGPPAAGSWSGRSYRLSYESWRARSWPTWLRHRASLPGRLQPRSV